MKHSGIVAGVFVGTTILWVEGIDFVPFGRLIAFMVLRTLIFLLALAPHELAHAMAARMFGGDEATDSRRISLNPVGNFDLVGMVAVPLCLIAFGSPITFGWAKSVPVRVASFESPRFAMALVAAAGPIASLGIALTIDGVLRLAGLNGTEGIAASFVWWFMTANLSIGLINLLPVPPLDGWRILSAVLPCGAAPAVGVASMCLLMMAVAATGGGIVSKAAAAVERSWIYDVPASEWSKPIVTMLGYGRAQAVTQ